MILTEEELKELENKHMSIHPFTQKRNFTDIDELIASHRELFKSNAELSYQTMLRVKYEGFLRSVIRCKGNLEDDEDFEWFKKRNSEIMKSLEELK